MGFWEPTWDPKGGSAERVAERLVERLAERVAPRRPKGTPRSPKATPGASKNRPKSILEPIWPPRPPRQSKKGTAPSGNVSKIDAKVVPPQRPAIKTFEVTTPLSWTTFLQLRSRKRADARDKHCFCSTPGNGKIRGGGRGQTPGTSCFPFTPVFAGAVLNPIHSHLALLRGCP